MNKKECIDYIVSQLGNEELDYVQRKERYELCKGVCSENGYGGGTFEQLWNAALDRKFGVRPNPPI